MIRARTKHGLGYEEIAPAVGATALCISRRIYVPGASSYPVSPATLPQFWDLSQSPSIPPARVGIVE